jgi:quercetin dioxygenase-like cupin family protein
LVGRHKPCTRRHQCGKGGEGDAAQERALLLAIQTQRSKEVDMRGRLALILAVLAAVAATLFTQAAVATPPSGITREVLAQSTVARHATIVVKRGTDVVVQHITVAPGGTTGWHSHPGAAVILVKSGAFTLYRAKSHRCVGHTYTAGTGFVERPGDVHIGRNESTTTPVEIYATYFNVPVGGSVVIDEPDPGTCPF